MSFDSSQLKKVGPPENLTPQALSDQQQKIQSNTQQGLQTLDKAAILGGNYIPDVDLTTGGKQIAHKLGKKAQGFIVYNINAAATVYRTDSEDESTFIKLISSANCKASVLVF